MIESMPDRCPSCGNGDLEAAVSVVHEPEKVKIATVKCHNCGDTVADRERFNYKPPVKPDSE